MGSGGEKNIADEEWRRILHWRIHRCSCRQHHCHSRMNRGINSILLRHTTHMSPQNRVPFTAYGAWPDCSAAAPLLSRIPRSPLGPQSCPWWPVPDTATGPVTVTAPCV